MRIGVGIGILVSVGWPSDRSTVAVYFRRFDYITGRRRPSQSTLRRVCCVFNYKTDDTSNERLIFFYFSNFYSGLMRLSMFVPCLVDFISTFVDRSLKVDIDHSKIIGKCWFISSELAHKCADRVQSISLPHNRMYQVSSVPNPLLMTILAVHYNKYL